MAKSKKRFKIIDKGNHVIKKDLMTSTVYSFPKPENEDEFEWIDLTELASEKYPHLEDDCE